MGMFDTVIVPCPNCGEEADFQTKSGDRMLKYYTLQDCPDDVFIDVNRHSPYECDCGVYFEVDEETRQAIIVPPKEQKQTL